MSRKPKLPGAADFFALTEEQPAPEENPQPARAPARRQPSLSTYSEEVIPPLTVAQGPTEKVTFYLHPNLLKRLELLKATLLVNHNLKVTRSQIMDLLLALGLERSEEITERLLETAE